MTDATSKPGADGARGEGRIGGKGATSESTGAHSPLVAPTGTEAPERVGSEGRREAVPGAVPPAVGDRDGARGGEGGLKHDSGARGLGHDSGERGLGRDSGERGLGRDSGERDPGRDSVAGGVKTSGRDARLLPHEESDKLSTRLQHAVAGFVDEPRSAVEEADHVLEEVAARFADAVKERRRTLRNSWQAGDGGQGKGGAAGDTEQLRLALRDYRELTERLLHS
ncbi:hypothetical protein [Streptomyces griseorubiginosus]|uniref:Uncharacterized protein n=1 Tax=Streptomyces griseorubiginosus TaxID=67304 RepID=A0A117R2Y1_9ACTN|nr:hypothetical protein [Streptomyces griseorubiginosus]KUN68171.1 hypothetical protein AQJ54_09430 [Streptomyces griseorubiginosus]